MNRLSNSAGARSASLCSPLFDNSIDCFNIDIFSTLFHLPFLRPRVPVPGPSPRLEQELHMCMHATRVCNTSQFRLQLAA